MSADIEHAREAADRMQELCERHLKMLTKAKLQVNEPTRDLVLGVLEAVRLAHRQALLDAGVVKPPQRGGPPRVTRAFPQAG